MHANDYSLACAENAEASRDAVSVCLGEDRAVKQVAEMGSGQAYMDLVGAWLWRSDAGGCVTQVAGSMAPAVPGEPLWARSVKRQPSAYDLQQKISAGLAFRNVCMQWLIGDQEQWFSISGIPVHDDCGCVIGYCGAGVDVTPHVREMESLRTLAHIDNLTGLPNRAMFRKELDVCMQMQHCHSFALALIDVDHFKSINDTFGHDVGDMLLKEVSALLRGALPAKDILARLGGDEFAVIMRDVAGLAEIAVRMQAVLRALEQPVQINGQAFRASISAGLVLCPTQAAQASNAMKFADVALYESKSQGRGCYTVYHSSFSDRVEQRIRVIRNIRQALDRGDMLVHYQPVLDPNSNRLVAVEALLRWRKSDGEIVAAGRFQDAFSDASLSAQLGRFVAEQAVSQAAQWLKDGVEFGLMSINVTTADFSIGEFPAFLSSLLDRYGVPASRICVEITEGMVLGDEAGHVYEGLSALIGMGVEVAFDDYGTGFASLTHLRMPVQRIKIDKSFARGIEKDRINQDIVAAIATLTHRLGKSVTIEGIESLDQVEVLNRIGRFHMQGFLFSKPVPAEQIPPLIDQFQWKTA